jgi:hypothetical protein
VEKIPGSSESGTSFAGYRCIPIQLQYPHRRRAVNRGISSILEAGSVVLGRLVTRFHHVTIPAVSPMGFCSNPRKSAGGLAVLSGSSNNPDFVSFTGRCRLLGIRL